jgi:hypothetical protein
LLYEQDFDPTAQSWNTITLDTPVPIEGEDLWVGYMFDKPGGVYTPGCDAGPAADNGDWMSHGENLGWTHLSDVPELDFNWNIAATLTGELATQWLTVTPEEGTLVEDEVVTVTFTLDAAGLTEDGYIAKVKIRSNDPENEIITIPVNLVVVVGVNENDANQYIMVYPNPANDYLRISNMNGVISHVRLTNTVGQVVIDQTMNTPNVKVDISQLPTGVYMATIDTDNGVAVQKVIVE